MVSVNVNIFSHGQIVI